MDRPLKPLVGVGSSLKDLRAFPRRVRREVGRALRYAQLGGKHPSTRPLQGFGGAGVLEVIEDDDGNTYRAVYTVRLSRRVYLLHAFQKKARRGIKTPKHELELIRSRLKQAEQIHRRFQEEGGPP